MGWQTLTSHLEDLDYHAVLLVAVVEHFSVYHSELSANQATPILP